MDKKALINEIYAIADSLPTTSFLGEEKFLLTMLTAIYNKTPGDSISVVAPFIDSSYNKNNYGVLLATTKKVIFVEKSFGKPWIVENNMRDISGVSMDGRFMSFSAIGDKFDYYSLDVERCSNLFKFLQGQVTT